MKEFIFGSLGLQEQRLTYVQELRNGIKHLNRLEPMAPGPGDKPLLTVTVGQDTAVRTVVCKILEPEPTAVELTCRQIDWNTLSWSYYQTWQAALPAFPAGTLVRYIIEATPQDGGSPITPDDGRIFSYLVGDPSPPEWAAGAIIYQVFPDRFHPGDGQWNQTDNLDDIFGGTLRGIIQNLDYIADMGFNCIWLNPFFPDHTHHGYHATDYFAVNPRLGTAEDIRELVDKAHSLGIRLLLDFVANHWGSRHETFQAAQADRESEYYHWYNWIEWPHEYQTFFGVRDLPQINLDHRPAREHLLEAAVYWLTEFDFDGFRLDYALGPSMDFWTEFRAVVKAARPDAWIFGEVVETPLSQLRYWGRLDGNLDFVLQQAFRNTFAFEETTLREFDAFLNMHEAFFPQAYSRPSFLDNHDVNRFLWLVEGDKRRLKLAALCQFTLAGPPVVYYGTEVGLSQERDMVQDDRHIMAECRLPMLWGEDQDQELREYYRRLVNFRRQHPVLWNGRRQTVHLDQTTKTYAYTRTDDHETVTIALNLSHQPQTIETADHTFHLPPYGGDVHVS
jgi:glycosidase